MRDIYYAYSYVSILCFASICSLYRLKGADIASRTFAIFVTASFICEFVAHLCAVNFGNNMPVYAVYSLVEFFMVSLYFNYTIDTFKRRNLGWIIGVVGVGLGLLNIFFVQGLNRMNSYFMIFEGAAIITMGLYLFLRLFLRNEQFEIRYYHHFWFTTILVFFWAVTLTNWSLYNYFLTTKSDKLQAINAAVLIFNMFIYLSIACVFILLPYMKKRYAR